MTILAAANAIFTTWGTILVHAHGIGPCRTGRAILLGQLRGSGLFGRAWPGPSAAFGGRYARRAGH